MRDVTRILQRIEQGESGASQELFPAVYDELRQVAAARMAAEPPGQTLGATALVHESYVRLAGARKGFESRAQFFAAAAEAMRRILVDRVRARHALKRGGGRRADVDVADLAGPPPDDARLLALDEALDRLAREAPRKAELVKMRYFAGCSIEEAAGLLGISTATADRDWAFARAWLKDAIGGADDDSGPLPA